LISQQVEKIEGAGVERVMRPKQDGRLDSELGITRVNFEDVRICFSVEVMHKP
jgi:hypothetical protein